MALDSYGRSKVEASPANNFVAVVPSDTTDLRLSVNGLQILVRALYVGTGGDVVATNADGTDVTFSNVADGQILDISPIHVKAATSADDIVALY